MTNPAAAKKPKLFAVILHFGSLKNTAKAQQALTACDAQDWDLTIVLVDNSGCEEVTPEFAKESAKIIHSGKNLGYAGGMNLGIQYALKHGADYLLLLNNDLFLAQNALKHFATGIRRRPESGLWGGAIFYADDPERIWFGGGRVHKWLGRTMHVGYKKRRKSPTRLAEGGIDYITGAMMLIDRKVFEKCGLFDMSLFLYFEDADFCLRAQETGFTPTFCPAVEALHQVGASDGSGGPTAAYLYFQTRNRYYVLQQCGGRFYKLWLTCLHILIYTVLRIVVVFLSAPKNALPKIKALWRGCADSLKNVRGPYLPQSK